jgi:hypothetical protein
MVIPIAMAGTTSAPLSITPLRAQQAISRTEPVAQPTPINEDREFDEAIRNKPKGNLKYEQRTEAFNKWIEKYRDILTKPKYYARLDQIMKVEQQRLKTELDIEYEPIIQKAKTSGITQVLEGGVTVYKTDKGTHPLTGQEYYGKEVQVKGSSVIKDITYIPTSEKGVGTQNLFDISIKDFAAGTLQAQKEYIKTDAPQLASIINNPNYVVEKNAQGQVTRAYEKPQTYQSYYQQQKGKDKDIRVSEYVPHEIIFDSKGNVTKEIYRKDYQFDTREDAKGYREERRIMDAKEIAYDPLGFKSKEINRDISYKPSTSESGAQYNRGLVRTAETLTYSMGELVGKKEIEYDKGKRVGAGPGILTPITVPKSDVISSRVITSPSGEIERKLDMTSKGLIYESIPGQAVKIYQGDKNVPLSDVSRIGNTFLGSLPQYAAMTGSSFAFKTAGKTGKDILKEFRGMVSTIKPEQSITLQTDLRKQIVTPKNTILTSKDILPQEKQKFSFTDIYPITAREDQSIQFAPWFKTIMSKGDEALTKFKPDREAAAKEFRDYLSFSWKGSDAEKKQEKFNELFSSVVTPSLILPQSAQDKYDALKSKLSNYSVTVRQQDMTSKDALKEADKIQRQMYEIKKTNFESGTDKKYIGYDQFKKQFKWETGNIELAGTGTAKNIYSQTVSQGIRDISAGKTIQGGIEILSAGLPATKAVILESASDITRDISLIGAGAMRGSAKVAEALDISRLRNLLPGQGVKRSLVTELYTTPQKYVAGKLEKLGTYAYYKPAEAGTKAITVTGIAAAAIGGSIFGGPGGASYGITIASTILGQSKPGRELLSKDIPTGTFTIGKDTSKYILSQTGMKSEKIGKISDIAGYATEISSFFVPGRAPLAIGGALNIENIKQKPVQTIVDVGMGVGFGAFMAIGTKQAWKGFASEEFAKLTKATPSVASASIRTAKVIGTAANIGMYGAMTIPSAVKIYTSNDREFALSETLKESETFGRFMLGGYLPSLTSQTIGYLPSQGAKRVLTAVNPFTGILAEQSQAARYEQMVMTRYRNKGSFIFGPQKGYDLAKEMGFVTPNERKDISAGLMGNEKITSKDVVKFIFPGETVDTIGFANLMKSSKGYVRQRESSSFTDFFTGKELPKGQLKRDLMIKTRFEEYPASKKAILSVTKEYSDKIAISGSEVGSRTIKGFRSTRLKDIDIDILKKDVASFTKDILAKKKGIELKQVSPKQIKGYAGDLEVLNLNIVKKLPTVESKKGLPLESRESWIKNKYDLVRFYEGKARLTKVESTKVEKAKLDIATYEKDVLGSKYELTKKGYDQNIRDVKEFNRLFAETFKTPDLKPGYNLRTEDTDVFKDKSVVGKIVKSTAKSFDAVIGGSGIFPAYLSPKTRESVMIKNPADWDIYTNYYKVMGKKIESRLKAEGWKRVYTPEQKMTKKSFRVTAEESNVKFEFSDGSKFEIHPETGTPFASTTNLEMNLLSVTGPNEARALTKLTPEGIRVSDIKLQQRRLLVGSFADTRASKDLPRYYTSMKGSYLEAQAQSRLPFETNILSGTVMQAKTVSRFAPKIARDLLSYPYKIPLKFVTTLKSAQSIIGGKISETKGIFKSFTGEMEANKIIRVKRSDAEAFSRFQKTRVKYTEGLVKESMMRVGEKPSDLSKIMEPLKKRTPSKKQYTAEIEASRKDFFELSPIGRKAKIREDVIFTGVSVAKKGISFITPSRMLASKQGSILSQKDTISNILEGKYEPSGKVKLKGYPTVKPRPSKGYPKVSAKDRYPIIPEKKYPGYKKYPDSKPPEMGEYETYFEGYKPYKPKIYDAYKAPYKEIYPATYPSQYPAYTAYGAYKQIYPKSYTKYGVYRSQYPKYREYPGYGGYGNYGYGAYPYTGEKPPKVPQLGLALSKKDKAKNAELDKKYALRQYKFLTLLDTKATSKTKLDYL